MQTPTLRDIRERMLADLDYRLPAAQSRPAKSVLGVLTTVMSGAISSLYGFGQWITEQLDPMTCSEHWLTIWAERLQVPRKMATTSEGSVTLSGGTVPIPAGTRIRHADTNQLFTTVLECTTLDLISVNAVTAGSVGNLAAGTVLQLETPIAGVAMEVTIASDFTGGADQESTGDWRLRVAERLSERQRIGDADDYARWAKASHPDILDAKTEGNTPALGVVTIWALGKPTQPVLAESVLEVAQASLDRTRNMGCTVRLAAVQTQAVNIRIADIDEDTQPAIEAAISELLQSRAKFGSQLWPEEIERLILLYTDQFTLLAPVTKVVASEYQILTLGDVVWL